MSFTKTTEQSSNYNHLEKMPVSELLQNINNEDKTVPQAIEKALPQIEALVDKTVSQLKDGGRLFYIGAGTSGRLGIVDASECPPTFGVPFDLVIGLIAGGDTAIRRAVEFAEDDKEQAWKDLSEYHETGIPTGCITCNAGSPLAFTAEYPIEVVVGPEFVTGSSRMKAGTAQKLVLNMLSTATMIQLGHVKGNKMVDMQLSNHKLVDRGVRMIMDEIKVSEEEASSLLQQHKNVRKAIEAYGNR